MGLLKKKEKLLDQKTAVIKAALVHFDSLAKQDKGLAEKIADAANAAYSDEIIFEEFKIWSEEKDDEAFLYQVEHFWNTKESPRLSVEERDLSGNDPEIESIKKRAKESLKIRFAANLRRLADKKGLHTNEP